jgi:hypothetical protein
MTNPWPEIRRLGPVTASVRMPDPRLWDDAPVPASARATKPSYTVRLAEYLRARPHIWIQATNLERFGRQAWRTRLSQARRGQYRGGVPMRIDNRQRRQPSGAVISEYRYVP